MTKPAALPLSLIKEWALPLIVLLSCAAGIIALAVAAPFSHPTAGATAELPATALTLQERGDALHREIESVQAALLSDLKRPAAADDLTHRKTLEHQLSRLSAATAELHSMQRDLSGERAATGAIDASSSATTRATLVRGAMILLALGCIGAGFALVRRISGTIARPVEHFVEIARAIMHGRPKQRASAETAGHFRLLAEAFNQMIDARQQAEARLRQAHDSLELKVQARTAELYRSNKALLEESQQRAQAERDFQQAQKMDALGKLAGSIAHDFNNLLTVIIGGAECAQQQIAPAHPAFQLLQTVQQAGERAAGLTRPLLAFSRRQVLALETVNLNAAAEEASHMLQRLVGVNIQLRLDLAPDLHPVRANSNQIQQVIMNLAVNARDAMDGFGSLTIITRSAVVDEGMRERAQVPASEHWVELAVADTGTGMDEATQARIFEPFFTTKPAGRGTGLGLATVFGIVKQSNGILSVVSAPGEGSTFRVFLPATSIPMPEAVPEAASAPAETPRASGQETILLVDDEEDIRELATLTLEAQGYRVLSAPNAEEAVPIAEQHAGEIRALITDVVMPGMTGVQLAGLLIHIIPNLRILFVSGHNSESISADSALAAQSDYLQKPYRTHNLATKVHELLTAPTLRSSVTWSAQDFAEAV